LALRFSSNKIRLGPIRELDPAKRGRLLSLLSRPRDRQEIIEAWIVYGKAREPKHGIEFGEWAIMEKHLEQLIRQGRVVHKQGRYVRQ